MTDTALITLSFLVFIAFEVWLSIRRRAKTEEEINAAMFTRDRLIETLKSEIADKFGQTHKLARLAQNSAAEAEVAAAQAALKAQSAEGAAQRTMAERLNDIEGDITLNLGELGSVAVGTSLLELHNMNGRLAKAREDVANLTKRLTEMSKKWDVANSDLAKLEVKCGGDLEGQRKLLAETIANMDALQRSHSEKWSKLDEWVNSANSAQARFLETCEAQFQQMNNAIDAARGMFDEVEEKIEATKQKEGPVRLFGRRRYRD